MHLVGIGRLELPTSPLSGARSNRLSYMPESGLTIKQRVANGLPDRPQSTCLDSRRASLLRKEVIQPHLPIRLPCYDFTPIIGPTVVGCLLAVGSPVSGVADSRGVTGGVYKARERIHRGILIRDY